MVASYHRHALVIKAVVVTTVEPTLPTSAAITAFVMTVISWCGMLRTGVQLIHDDIKDSRSYKKEIKEMVDDLGRQNRKLDQWRKQWFFWEETPDSLHLQFWGKAEYSTIKIKLESMRAHYIQGEKELRPFAKLTETQWNSMKLPKRIIRIGQFISMKRKYVLNLIEKMAKILKELDDAARDGWQRDWPDSRKKTDGDFAQVQRNGIGHLLMRIAMRTHDYTEILWESCHFAQESLTTEMDLDIFGASLADSRDKCSEAITKAAAESLTTLTILTRGAQLQMAEMTRVCTKQSDISTQSNVTALVDALSHVVNGSQECHFIARSGLVFHVFKSRRHHYGPGSGMRETFREIQSRNSPPRFTNAALLGSISKFKIAFELAQACLLFLRTTWFSEICTCGIFCGKPSDVCDELQYDFTLQFGNVDHRPARWAGTRVRNCWGQVQQNWNFLTKPIRRLALLLIEVTLGTTVLETQCDTTGAFTFITFVEGEPSDLRKKRHSLDHVMENVRLAAHKSRSFKRAVRYCTTAQLPQTPDDTQMKELLAKFYWDVVVP